MKLADEPEHWHELWTMARSAPDTHSLALIIDQMNRLLDEHEWKADNDPRHVPSGRTESPAIALEVQEQQFD